MSSRLIQLVRQQPTSDSGCVLPVIVRQVGDRASRSFVEFFTATIRNKNTRAAYARAVMQLLDWCEALGLSLHGIEPVVVAADVEQHPGSRSTVKQHLAAIRMLFDWFARKEVLPVNPATSVRGSSHVVRRGKTPVLTADQARALLDSIDVRTIAGLRDRALLGVMVYSFARVSAVVIMRVGDYYQDGKRWWFRFGEKGGKQHHVPAHHNAEAYLDGYINAAGITDDEDGPLFRMVDRTRHLTERAMTHNDVLRMIKRRAEAAGLPPTTCCHTFRATGITAYLNNGGSIEYAQKIAGHESPRTTKLYDRTDDAITLDEVERIAI